MKVVFKRDVASVGKAGEVKEVADGYARNFLIPRGYAVAATKTELANVEARKAADDRHRARLDQERQALAKQIEAEPLVMQARAGARGRLHGSITSADVADALSKSLGQTIDKHDVELAEPIKTLGAHSAGVRLAARVAAKLQLVVEAEEA
jgi:large subunit ribosomal protein L9